MLKRWCSKIHTAFFKHWLMLKWIKCENLLLLFSAWAASQRTPHINHVIMHLSSCSSQRQSSSWKIHWQLLFLWATSCPQTFFFLFKVLNMTQNRKLLLLVLYLENHVTFNSQPHTVHHEKAWWLKKKWGQEVLDLHWEVCSFFHVINMNNEMKLECATCYTNRVTASLSCLFTRIVQRHLVIDSEFNWYKHVVSRC